MRTFSMNAIGLLLLFAPLGAMATQAQPDPNRAARFGVQSERSHWIPDQRHAPSSATQHFIVELQSPPIASFSLDNDLPGQLHQNASLPLFSQHQARLEQEVKLFEQSLRARSWDAQITHRFSTLINAVVVSGRQLDEAMLASLHGVKAVYPERLYTVHLDRSVPLLNAPIFWQPLGGQERAGREVKVAVIDSGIRPEHPMFSDRGFPSASGAVASDDHCQRHPSTFCNNKLVVARWYPPTFEVWHDEHQSPLDYHGHGTHVAAIAVGSPIEARYDNQHFSLSGVAPGARLMVYKALFATAHDPTRASGSSIMLLQALEDAVLDGADVINNSWGGAGEDPAASPFRQALALAEASGVVVTQAAGNHGPLPQTVSCPGCLEAGITVANSSPGRYQGKSLTVEGQTPIYAVDSSPPYPLSHPLRAPLVAGQQIAPNNSMGCAPFPPGSLTGQVVLLPRGNCPFKVKLQHLDAAGAVGLVVFNDRHSAPISMLLENAPFPAVMISNVRGMALLSQLLSGATLNATLSASNRVMLAEEFTDSVHLASSRGPNNDPTVLKPDIAAPGTNILSATSPTASHANNHGLALMTGTSMATPHLAGAAALMRARHRDWSAVEIKTALTSTARLSGLTREDGTTPATPFDVGAGRLDLEAASRAVLTFDRASYANPACIATCQFQLAVNNRGETAGEWAVTADIEGANVTVSPATLALEPESSAPVMVSIDATYTEKDRWHFGQLRLSGPNDAHLPLAIISSRADDTSVASIVGEAPTLPPGQQGRFHAHVVNPGDPGPVTVTLSVDPDVTLLDQSIEVEEVATKNSALAVGEDPNTLTWQGWMDAQRVWLYPTPYQPFTSHANATNRIPCLEACDETSMVYWTTPTFEFNGRDYNQLTISSNGFIAPGEVEASGTWKNQAIPSPRAPNNLIAPFWADLDLKDESGLQPNDGSAEGGTLHLYEVADETGSPAWLVVDWIKARLFDDASGQTYSFGVWLGIGSNKGHNLMRYYSMGAVTGDATVGVEDGTGNIGILRYHNGVGSPPLTGQTLKIETHPAGSITVNFSLHNAPMTTQRLITREDQPIRVMTTRQEQGYPLHLQASLSGQTLEALHLVRPSGAEVIIAAPPGHGSVIADDKGDMLYTPEPDYAGEDHFSYRLRGDAGHLSEPYPVTIEVTAVNDAPSIAMPLEYEARSGDTLAIPLVAHDPEQDPLRWHLSQQGEPTADYRIERSTLSLTAPSVSERHPLRFTLSASDAELRSEPVSLTVHIQPESDATPSDSGGGALAGWTLALLSLLYPLRRPKKHPRAVSGPGVLDVP